MPNPAFVDTAATGPTSSATETGTSGPTTQSSTLEPTTTEEPTTLTSGDPTDSTVDPSTTEEPTGDPTTDGPTTDPTSETDTVDPCDGEFLVEVPLTGDAFFLNTSTDLDPLCEGDCKDLNFGTTPFKNLAYYQDHRGMFAMRWSNPKTPFDLLDARLLLHLSSMGPLSNQTTYDVRRMPEGDSWWDIGVHDEVKAEIGDSSYVCRKVTGDGCLPWSEDPDENDPRVMVKPFAMVTVPANQTLNAGMPVEVEIPLEEINLWLQGSEDLDLLVIPMTINDPKKVLLYASENGDWGPKLKLTFACP